MKQTITVHELPPMLNGKNGLKRMHWTKYNKIRDSWVWLIRAENPEKHKGIVTISFTRFSTAMPDWDNLYSSFKVLGDSLEKPGIIKDDSPTTVKEWQKVNKQKYQRVEIEISDV